MLRLITKMTLLTFAFLLIASSVEARANSYLFRLTDDEINEVMSRYYPRGYDREAVLSQMSELRPQELRGPLEVGSDYAYRAPSRPDEGRMGFLEMIYQPQKGNGKNPPAF